MVGRIFFTVPPCVTGGAMERGAWKPHKLAAGTVALRSAGPPACDWSLDICRWTHPEHTPVCAVLFRLVPL